MLGDRRKVVNTEEQARKDPLVRGWVMGGNPNAILAQEASGQQSFVNSDTLPTRMSREDRKALEAAGVVFSEVVEGDGLFQYVQLPAGWKKVATGHSMWSDLVDDRGRKRASIFYKAAFYDRSARLSANCRYDVRIDYKRLDAEKVAVAMVTDGSETIYTTDPVGFEENDARYEAEDKARDLVVAWLNEHYPKWKDASAYWD